MATADEVTRAMLAALARGATWRAWAATAWWLAATAAARGMR